MRWFQERTGSKIEKEKEDGDKREREEKSFKKERKKTRN